MLSNLKFKIDDLKFDFSSRCSFEDALSSYFQTKNNSEVILEKILVSNENELFYLFGEYQDAISSPAFKHKNIIKYYDFKLDEIRQEVLVLREFSRKTLDSMLQSRRAKNKQYLTRNELLELSLQLLKALTQLEQSSIILLNLKPTNIFTNDELTYKIGGLARSDNHIWLNQEYLSPELKEDLELRADKLPQFLNRNYKNKKSAVYTLGMILLEAATLQDVSAVNALKSNLSNNKTIKTMLQDVEERYEGYRLFLERCFLPVNQRPDILECWCMCSDLSIIDGIILLGDAWNFDKSDKQDEENEKQEKKQEEQEGVGKDNQGKDKGPEMITVKKRCGGGFYYKKVLKKA